MGSLCKWLAFSAILLSSATEGARILAIVPMPARSHQAVFTPLFRELAARGHQITAYVPYKMPNPPVGYTEIVLPNFLAEMHDEVDVQEFGKVSALEQVVWLHQVGLFLQEKILTEESIRKLIHSKEKYDAVILESLFVQESLVAFQHKFGAIGIEIMPLGNSYWINDIVGNPHNPSYVLDFKSPFTDRMNFYERVYNTITSLGTSIIGKVYFMPKTQELMDKHFDYEGWESRPPLSELLSQKSLVLLNAHYSVNYPYAMAPHVIEVGGIHIQPNKPLPKDLQTYMDDAKDGVIYFSLGSNINVSDIAKGGVFSAFSSSFSKLKQKVLWKWEKELPNMPKNVKTSSWFPQQDILAHKNCKLFITHGGFLSMSEAVNFGVPMIGIPFFGDQPKNLKQVTSGGYGLELPFEQISEESVTTAINTILSNPSYQKAVEEKSKIFRDRPMKPLENAVYWVEHVLRHKGGEHLRPAVLHLKWYQSSMLDIALLFHAVVFTILLLTFLMIRKLLRLICCRGSRPQTDKKSKKKTN